MRCRIISDQGKKSLAVPTKWMCSRLGMGLLYRTMGAKSPSDGAVGLDKETVARLARCLAECKHIFGDWILLQVDTPTTHVELLP